MREITFDTETTGLDPLSGHKIVEIGCVELIDKVRTGKFLHKYINPQREIPRSATDIHGLTAEFLSDKPLFADIAKEFIEFIGDDKLVIHNASFDMKFINYELESCGHKPLKASRATDTLLIARSKFPGAKVNLDALCNRFGIDLSRRDKHGALLDAELLAEVYVELLGGRQGAMLLGGAEIVVESQKNDSSKRKYRVSRSFTVSTEELAEHAEFLKKIKNNKWQ